MKSWARRLLDKFIHHHQSYSVYNNKKKKTIAILFEQYLFLISTVGLQALSDNPRRKLTKSVLTDSVVVSHEPIAREARAYWPIDFFSSCKTLLKTSFFSRNWFLLFLLVYFSEKLSILTHLTLRHRLSVNRVFRICFDPR